MSLFQCDKCGCVENSACSDGGYMGRWLIKDLPEVLKSYREVLGLKPDEPFGNYCCVCNPQWFIEECTCGKAPHSAGCKQGDYGIGPSPKPKLWHNRFKRIFLPKGEWQTDRQGNLEHRVTKEKDYSKYAKESEYK